MDGLLTVTIPRKAEAAPRRIEVNAEVMEEEQDDEHAPAPYTLTLAAPGLSAADLEVTADEESLQVKGETERTGVRVAPKRFELPRDADAERATATHVDGLLEITIPKKSPAEAKMLVVSDGALAQ